MNEINLKEKYINYENEKKKFLNNENELIKLYENEIKNKLEKLEIEKNIKYDIEILIINDLINYINEMKIYYKYHYNNFNNYFNEIDILNIYKKNEYKETLNNKYNIKLCYDIFKNNDINFYMNDIIKNENENLFIELLEIKFKNIDNFIYKLFNELLNYFIYDNLMFYNYLSFLNELNNYLENYYNL